MHGASDSRFQCGRIIAIATALLLLGLAAAACASDSEQAQSDAGQTSTPAVITPPANRSPTELSRPIRIAVTLPLFEEFAREMGRENTEIISLIPPGADPHSYEFTAQDLERMKGIDFFFLNGLGLDSRLQNAIEANRKQEAHVILFAPNIRSPQGGDLTADQAGDNAHLWLDPTLAYVYPEIVADELIIYDGVRRDFYDDNFAGYRTRTLAMQDRVQEVLATIPPERKKLVTLHDSFAHFGRRFGLSVSGFLSEAPGEANEGDIIRLVKLVRDQQLPAVFTEFGYDPGPMQRVSEAAGVPLCMLYSDIINEAVATYEQLMLANAQEMARCLGVH